MGWMWSSSPSPAAAPSTGLGPVKGEAQPQTQNQTQAPAVPMSRGAQTSTTTTTTDYGDPEIARFMAQINEELGTKPTAAEPAKPSTTAPARPSSWWSSRGTSPSSTSPQQKQQQQPPLESTTSDRQPSTTTTTQRLDPLSESLLPTTMSCRAAFDAAFHCNSLGGQWTSVYRSGGVRSCSEHWDDFWFCMRTRAYPAPLKEEAIRDHYRRRELARYHGPGKPSSADVWEPRTERLPPGTAFREPLGPMPHDLSDEEWYAMEIERRRRIQEALRDT
ncbi:hypothetical protein DL769_007727 [Monosporascus sp. CRB-8-3]|nr:hypothetical protein DL769_007727 [Monosporascus sp. CRB-8-3]